MNSRSVAASVNADAGQLRLAGEVTAVNAVALRRQGEAVIAGASGDVVVDLSGLRDAHSIVLSLLMCWQRAATAARRNLRFSGANSQLAALARLSGLLGYLPGIAHSQGDDGDSGAAAQSRDALAGS